jgi:hypothetical protein
MIGLFEKIGRAVSLDKRQHRDAKASRHLARPIFSLAWVVHRIGPSHDCRYFVSVSSICVICINRGFSNE